MVSEKNIIQNGCRVSDFLLNFRMKIYFSVKMVLYICHESLLFFGPAPHLAQPPLIFPRPSQPNIGDFRSVLSLFRFYLGDSQRPAGAGRVTCGRGSRDLRARVV